MLGIVKSKQIFWVEKMLEDIIVGSPGDLLGLQMSDELANIVKFNGRNFRGRFKMSNA